MKVNECSNNNNSLSANYRRNDNNPNFKGFVNVAGATMQFLENQGYWASFLIQDGLGMTMPRVITGFQRDKEVTGKYNMQEGTEVLLREGLTGPLMMLMAPLCLLFASKFGKSTGVNSQLIKRFGNSLKEFISKSENKDIINDTKKFTEEFYRKNIAEILEKTVGKENYSETNVNNLVELVKSLKSKKGKAKRETMDQIVKYFNDLQYNSSNNLNMLETVKFGNGQEEKAFGTKNTIEALINYTDDAISLRDKLKTLDEASADKLKYKSIGKRAVTTVTTVLATLGVMSVIPKIYAKNDIAPGVRTAMELKQSKEANASKSNVSFRQAPIKKSLLEKIGKKVAGIKEKWTSELEYNGINFTSTLMAGLSVFGLLAPRGARAVNRAQKDETGRKDYTELYEILIRDLISSLSVVFLVPLVTRMFVSSYEKVSGFVLMNKDRSRTGSKKFLDLINPYSSAKVLSNKELTAIYRDVDTKSKMLNFCEFIDKNGGDLRKILSKSEFKDGIFNSSTLSLDSLVGSTREEGNKAIIDIVKNLGDNADSLVKDLMQKTSKRNHKIYTTARGLNSVPALLTTFCISPIILGRFIPMLTYANTRRIHAKREAEIERNKKFNTAV